MTDSSETDFDFRGKYTEGGRIGGLLVDRFYAAIARTVRRFPPKSALEAGCGEGFSTQRLVPLLGGARFESLDVETRLVEAARAKNPGVEIREASVYALPYDDDAFELVFCMEVLEHLEDPDAALRELRRVSARHLLLTVPREPIWRSLNMARGKYLRDLGNTPGHLQHWSRRQFLRFVSQVGRPLVVETPLPWTQVLVDVSGGR